MPIHPRWLKVFNSMTKTYCKGKKLKKFNEYEPPTCSKARNVFYATMKAKGIDYTKPPETEETIQHIEKEANYVDEIIEWVIKNDISN